MHSSDEVHKGAEEGEDSACGAGEHDVPACAGCLNSSGGRAAGCHTPVMLNGKHGSSDVAESVGLYSCSLKRKYRGKKLMP